MQKMRLFHRLALEKCLQTEWIRVFWPVSLEQHFSQREDLYRNTANNIHSHYRGNSEEKYLARFPNF